MSLRFRSFLTIFFTVAFCAVFDCRVASASDGGSSSISRSHLVGSLSIGFGSFGILSPASDIKLNNGQLLSLQGEKSFGFLHLYLEAMVNYLKTTGSSNYRFTSSTAIYSANNVNFSLDEFQGGFGIRFKVVENYPIRPYFEAGGTGGYFQTTYDSNLKTPAVLSAGGDFKTVDDSLDFGPYIEAGIEIELSQNFGFRLSDRYSDCTTRAFDTLNKQPIHYFANFYMLALFTSF